MLQMTYPPLRDRSRNKKLVRRTACDSCRAKKRRCDWQAATATCSICRKSNALCVFNYVSKAQRSKHQTENHNTSEPIPEVFEGDSDSHVSLDEAGLARSTINDSVVSAHAIPDKTMGSTSLLSNDHTARTSSTYAPAFDFHNRNALPIHVQRQGLFDEPAICQESQPNSQVRPEEQFLRAYDLPLPPASECSVEELWILVQEFLEDFNRAIPLFDEMWVTGTFRRLYQANEEIPITSFLCFQVIFAITHRLRAQSPISTCADDLRASKYLQFVCSQIGDLFLQRPSLEQAQCLMGLGVLLQGTGSPERACGLISAALRILDQLNKNALAVCEMNKLEPKAQARLVWWIGLFIDTSICLRKDLPPTISLEAAEIDLPRLNFLVKDDINQHGIIRSVDNKTKLNILQAHAELAILQMKSLRILSPSSVLENLWQDDNVDLRILKEQFGSWRASFSCPVDFVGIRATFHRSDIVHICILEAKAFETICTIYGITQARLLRMMRCRSSEDGLNLVGNTMIMESKRFLQLFTLTPHGDIACNRLNSEASVLASLILFLSIVQFPLCPESRLKHGLAQFTILQIKKLDEAGDAQALSAPLRACLWLDFLAEKLINGTISQSAALHRLGCF